MITIRLHVTKKNGVEKKIKYTYTCTHTKKCLHFIKNGEKINYKNEFNFCQWLD